MLPVADMGAVTIKVLRRLETRDAPLELVIIVGWDGTKINANLGDYNKITKSLPTERVSVRRGMTEEEACTQFLLAVARLQQSLRGKTARDRARPPKGGHLWRVQARRNSVARDSGGE